MRDDQRPARTAGRKTREREREREKRHFITSDTERLLISHAAGCTESLLKKSETTKRNRSCEEEGSEHTSDKLLMEEGWIGGVDANREGE